MTATLLTTGDKDRFNNPYSIFHLVSKYEPTNTIIFDKTPITIGEYTVHHHRLSYWNDDKPADAITSERITHVISVVDINTKETVVLLNTDNLIQAEYTKDLVIHQLSQERDITLECIYRQEAQSRRTKETAADSREGTQSSACSEHDGASTSNKHIAHHSTNELDYRLTIMEHIELLAIVVGVLILIALL